MTLPIFAALAASFCWAISSLFTVDMSRKYGPVNFNRIRLTVGIIPILLLALLSRNWQNLSLEAILILLASGFIGFYIGDSFLYECSKRCGPRKTGLLFALNGPIAMLLSWVFLKHQLSYGQLAGAFLVMAGVFVAILWGRPKGVEHAWEANLSSMSSIVLVGLGAAAFQAIGLIMIKPIMRPETDVIASTGLRILGGLVPLYISALLKKRANESIFILKRDIWFNGCFNGILAIVIGVSLLNYAMKYGHPGLVAVLSSTSPVFILPLLWIKTQARPAFLALLGAILVVAGLAMI